MSSDPGMIEYLSSCVTFNWLKLHHVLEEISLEGTELRRNYPINMT